MIRRRLRRAAGVWLGQPSSHDYHVSVCSTRDQLVQPLEKRERAKKLGLVWERDEIEADKNVDANFVACTLGLELCERPAP
jgi:hypothetical protein